MTEGNTYYYYCYGLRVLSEMPVPEMRLDAPGPVDVHVRYGDVDRLPTPDDQPGSFAIEENGHTIHFWMNAVGGLIMRDGSEMIIHPAPGAEERGYRFLISGIGLGFALHQRGIPSLHASAVDIHGAAVAFVGWKGMGKSTTAAAFHAHGAPIVTDDVLPLYSQEDAVMVAPAFPHLKLWPNSLEAVFKEDPQSQPLIDPEGLKRTRAVETGFSASSLPLACVYVLDWNLDRSDPEPHIQPLSVREACVELLRHSFALRMFEDRGATPQQLQETAALARRIPVRRLRRPPNLGQLSEVIACVESDLQESDLWDAQPAGAAA